MILGFSAFIFASSYNSKYKKHFDEVTDKLERDRLQHFDNSKR